jgi:hypothetical protein
MADCICESIDSGIEKDCNNNVGGLKSPMWVTEKCNIVSLGLSSPEGIIDTITMEAGTFFYPYEFNKNTSSYTEVKTMDEANGTALNVQTLTLILNRREKTKRDNLQLLDQFKELVIITKDSNNKLILLGEDAGMTMTTNEGGSGVAKSDRNGYTITFVGQEPELANEVDEAALIAVLAP